MNTIIKNYTFILLAIVLLSACEKREYQSVDELDRQNIQNYVQKNNLQVQEFENTGIFYRVIEEGTGRPLEYDEKTPLVFKLKTLDGSYASVDTFSAANRYYDYLGYFPYGSSAANSPGSPLDKETGMKLLLKKALKNTNGKIQILVPSKIAFGRNGTNFIPPNASIDYEIHAIDIDDIPIYEDVSIRKYMQANGLDPATFVKTPTGIYYKISEVGTGEFLEATTTFKAAYDLKFMDGKTFQKSDSSTFRLNGVIEAWQEVLPNLKPKGKVRMLIPSSQAYGMNGSVDQMTGAMAIAPFASLDYAVEVLKIVEDK